MKLGIMSDSHGRTDRVREALARFDDCEVGAIAHCGDVGSLEVLEELAGRNCRFVWGNTDIPAPGWRVELEALGLPWPGTAPVEWTLAGKRIAIFHGHESSFPAALGRASHDYLLHGHTHQRADARRNGMRVINPGALQRSARPSVAVLDLAADELMFIEVA